MVEHRRSRKFLVVFTFLGLAALFASACSSNPPDGTRRETASDKAPGPAGSTATYPVDSNPNAVAAASDPEGGVWVATTYSIQQVGEDGTIKMTIPFGEIPDEPWSLVVDGDGNPWISMMYAAVIIKYDKDTGDELVYNHYPQRPGAMNLAYKDGKIYVATQKFAGVTRPFFTGNLMVLNMSGETVAEGAINSGDKTGYPEGIYVDQDGSIWFSITVPAKTKEENDTYEIWKAVLAGDALNVVATAPAGNVPAGIVGGSDRIWVANICGDNEPPPDKSCAQIPGSVTILDPSNMSTRSTVLTQSYPQSVAIDANGFAWTGASAGDEVYKIDVSGNIVRTVTLPDQAGPMGITLDNKGNIWTANTGDNSVSKIDPDNE